MTQDAVPGDSQGRDHRSTHRRVVVKLGSNLLTGGSDRLDEAQIGSIVHQVASLHRQGLEPVVVTSGAIAAGRAQLGFPRHRKDIPFKQMLAAVGQGRLMEIYDRLFATEGIVVAQALLTKGDLAKRLRYLNARNTLMALLDHHVVPIINENDAVAVDEIRFGDNDTLSALVASLVDADLLVIMTDIAGLYTADPHHSSDATLIPVVEEIDSRVERLAAGAGSLRGTGGMRTKVEAARLATQWGISVRVVDGRVPGILLDAAHDRPVGTHFLPRENRVESRKRWISSGLVKHGSVVVDEGAAHALREGGRSLLPAGIVAVRGSFTRGDAIDVLDQAGEPIACGLTNYRSADVNLLRGLRSGQIEATLGYEFGDEIIHRNNLVLL
jgi:glutamate 5-kinase